MLPLTIWVLLLTAYVCVRPTEGTSKMSTNTFTGPMDPVSIPNRADGILSGNIGGVVPNVDTILDSLNITLTSKLLSIILQQKYSPKTKGFFKKEYDYVIVGGGVAGSVLANRLSETECVSVLLLEAGRTPPVLSEFPCTARFLLFTDINWNFMTEPQIHTAGQQHERRIPYPAGRGLGGSSLINAMIYIRGHHEDYNDWEKMGAKGWSWEDVFPYFRKLEDNKDSDFLNNGYHNTSGPMTANRVPYTPKQKLAILAGAKSRGYKIVDPNAASQTGFSDFQTFTRNGQRCSAAKAYLVPAEDRPNLDILIQAFVKKIQISGKRATGVHFDYKGEPCFVSDKREVILSAGAVNTPKILMLSGIGDEKVLKKHNIEVKANLPGVGNNLQDHQTAVIFFSVKPPEMTILSKVVSPPSILEYATKKSGPIASPTGIFQLAFLRSNDSVTPKDVPNHELYFIEGENIAAQFTFGLKPQVYEQMFAPYKLCTTMWCFSSLTRPKSKGYVSLRSSNPYDPPIIDPKFCKDEQDVKDLVAGLKTCLDVARTKPVREAGIEEFQTCMPGCEHLRNNEDEYLKCYVRQFTFSISHQSCTARMGDPSDPNTVVDPQLRVIGIEQLRVIDASVMPKVVSGNTDIPTTMIAEKASDMIKETISC